MKEIHLNERIALGKLAEHISSNSMINGGDFIWISQMFGILEYQDVNKWLAYAIDFQPTKNITIFGFLHLVYTKYPDKFPELVGEVLRRYFVNNIGNLLKYKEQAKQFLDIITQTFERYLMILGYDMQLNIHMNTLDLMEVHLVEREIDETRHYDQSKLYNILEERFPEVYIAIKGAYERYFEGGINANRQAISSCRNAYENFFKIIIGSQQWKQDLQKHIESTTLIKLIRDTYSYLSGSGDHSPAERTKEDTFLAIRLTEDIIMRMLKENDMW